MSNSSTTGSKFLSFSDLTVSNLDQAFNLLRNGWDLNRLDRKQSSSILLLDTQCRASGVIALPLRAKTETLDDAKKLVALMAKENAQSLVIAQNNKYGVVVPDNLNRRFASHMTEAVKEEGLVLFDYFLINHLGYYSFEENEYRICPSPYTWL